MLPNKRLPARLRRLSDKGLLLIARFEGLARLKPGSPLVWPYNDPVGYATIGYGHLIRYGPVRSTDKPITRAQALKLLRSDSGSAASCVRKYVKVGLTQHAFDALVSLVVNIGCGNFSSSTLLRKLNAKDYRGAADQFLVWDVAGGQHMIGLHNRRVLERLVFIRGDYP